jgi:hypothetical protein
MLLNSCHAIDALVVRVGLVVGRDQSAGVSLFELTQDFQPNMPVQEEK